MKERALCERCVARKYLPLTIGFAVERPTASQHDRCQNKCALALPPGGIWSTAGQGCSAADRRVLAEGIAEASRLDRRWAHAWRAPAWTTPVERHDTRPAATGRRGHLDSDCDRFQWDLRWCVLRPRGKRLVADGRGDLFGDRAALRASSVEDP